ncbi:MAG: hypothetical protein AAGJ38_00130 [Planctomycetota bacterium]
MSRTLPLIFALLAMLAVCPVEAQSNTPRSVEAALADTFTREAMRLATMSDPPTPAAIDAATLLLERATALTPRDAERYRLKAELAKLAGDAEARNAALAAYVRLEPRDDAAMLQLLLARVQGTQTLDGRLAAIENVLNARNASARLSAPLRSRLAWLAAEAAQELGDTKRHVRWLRESASLDPAFAPAARTTYTLLAERGHGPKTLGAAAKNWVEAAPVDPAARLALADVLFTEAAYLDAAQQYANAARLSTTAPLPWPAYRAWALSLGASGDTQIALDLLTQLENLVAAGQVDEAQPSDDGLEPGLPVELELVRLTLLGGAQHDDPERDLDALDDTLTRVRALMSTGVVAGQDRAWIEAIFGNPENVGRALGGVDFESVGARRALGWAALRRGDTREAEDTLNKIQNDPLAKLGLAILTAVDDPGRARFFREIIRDTPESLAALITAQKLLRDGRSPEPTAIGQTVLDLMQRTPIQVWRLDLDREPWLTLSMKARPVAPLAFEPATLEVSVRNNAPVAVSIGPGMTINGTVLLNTGVFAEGQAVGTLPTQVVDVSRRLSLNPGERIVIPYRLDWGTVGQSAAEDPSRTFAFAMSGVLDPNVSGDGVVIMGPMGSTDTLRGLQLEGQAVTDESVSSWIERVSGEEGVDPFSRVYALTRLAMIGEGPLNNLVSPATSDRIAETLNTGARGFDSATLGLVISRLETRPGSVVYQPLLDAAARSDQTNVRLAHLLGQADGPDHPALDAAERSTDADLRAFAAAYRDALRPQEPAGASAEDLLPMP